MTQESNSALLARLGVEDPLSFLLRGCQRLLTKAQASCDPMVIQPNILQWLARVTESRLALTSHLDSVPPLTLTAISDPNIEQAVEDSVRIASLPGPLTGAPRGEKVTGQHGPRYATLTCPTCQLSFPDLATLKRHHQKYHETALPNPNTSVDAAAVRNHSVDGMPVCMHCGRDYVTWFNLKRHIQKGHCLKQRRNACGSAPEPFLSSPPDIATPPANTSTLDAHPSPPPTSAADTQPSEG